MVYLLNKRRKQMKTQKRKFYGYEFKSGTHTTCGEPNRGFERFNGRLSIAGDAKLFYSKKERDEWIQNYRGFNAGRVAVSRAELRRLCAGMENENFAEYLEMLELMAE
jgi:hypothetical protein